MKFLCPCGATIEDPGGGLPHKAELIPDQEWDSISDSIDKIINDAIAKRIDAEEAWAAIFGRVLGNGNNVVRRVYQCRTCGRLFVGDQHHQLHCFVPAPDENVPKEILRSRDGDGWDR